jgi:hypothetical protein
LLSIEKKKDMAAIAILITDEVINKMRNAIWPSQRSSNLLDREVLEANKNVKVLFTTLLVYLGSGIMMIKWKQEHIGTSLWLNLYHFWQVSMSYIHFSLYCIMYNDLKNADSYFFRSFKK